MQLTLDQAEIELALREYVGRIFTTKNGTEMIIDFSATRGDRGITAKIDIVPAGTKPTPTGPVTREQAVSGNVAAPAPTPIARTVPFAQASVSPAPVVHEVVTGEATTEEAPFVGGRASDDVQGSEEVGNEPTSGAPAPVEATDGAGSAPAGDAPAPNRSLFGGLRKPKNN